MLKLYVRDNISGAVHEYGTSRHDALVLQEDGSLHYENMQCCTGTKCPEEGYSFCREDGSLPNPADIDCDAFIDIGGCVGNSSDLSHIMLMEVAHQIGSYTMDEVVLFNINKISKTDALRAVEGGTYNENVLCIPKSQWISLFKDGKE